MTETDTNIDTDAQLNAFLRNTITTNLAARLTYLDKELSQGTCGPYTETTYKYTKDGRVIPDVITHSPQIYEFIAKLDIETARDFEAGLDDATIFATLVVDGVWPKMKEWAEDIVKIIRSYISGPVEFRLQCEPQSKMTSRPSDRGNSLLEFIMTVKGGLGYAFIKKPLPPSIDKQQL